MRRFSAEYLRDTRRGMWAEGERAALEPLSLPDREVIVDVGCGTGELSVVLAAEASEARVVGVDRDPDLLGEVPAPVEPVRGDALSLPVRDGTADLVVCQALLVNLPDPTAAIREFARASADLVAVVEPDNAAVTVESTVEAEERLAARARDHYLDGVATDVGLGAVPDRFEAAGLVDVETARYDFARTVEPPYTEADVAAARRKVSGSRLADQREVLTAGELDAEAYDALREEWKAMGREVAEAMAEGTYRRREVVPFFVTVGRGA
ncbi:class I SAM-dependent methyltransferase [Halomarina litorea]|uniref:class I SAM-dependent methyltransferase n=1 Tax=Halomarina litorea TaxID=2961595 RepID=UPI0020C2FA92|nr:class I SAM-dependent methyltransferase [Halomarina sp. BCD28]